VQIVLTDDERRTLQRWAWRRTSGQTLALRCRIVLACAQGLSNVAVGEQLGVHPVTVAKWRTRFAIRRLEGLSDDPRPGGPRSITDEQVEQVIVKTLEETPTDATHWSTRSMARASGMSQAAISRIWRAFGLKPHLAETWKLSSDLRFSDKARDLCGLYLNPPEAAVVLCVDEKSQIQALDRTAPVPLVPGSPRRRGHDYTRYGTTNLHTALNQASGLVISQMTPRYRAIEFKRFLARIDQAVPAGLDVHVVCDSSSTHETPAIRRWLVAHPRFHVHFTPTYGSWLSVVERLLAELTAKWLKRGGHRSVPALTASIQSWIDTWNEQPRPLVWHKTADQILDSIARYPQPI
jgi:transposase